MLCSVLGALLHAVLFIASLFVTVFNSQSMLYVLRDKEKRPYYFSDVSLELQSHKIHLSKALMFSLFIWDECWRVCVCLSYWFAV